MFGIAALTSVVVATAPEWFMYGATAAITLFTGTKLPKNKRK